MLTIFINILCPILAYLIGTINPAYFFGRLKGIDIKSTGTKNAGTTNLYHTLGIVYAVPTAVYDVLKGLLALLIAFLLGANFIIINICGLLAIVGHIFPFYLKFRGGQGVATSTGLLLFYIINYMFSFNWIDFLFFLAFMLLLVGIFAYVTRKGEFLSIILLPVFGFYIFIRYPTNPFDIFLWIILLHIITIGLYNIIHQKLITIENEEFKRHWWRTATRPLAVLFIIFHYFLPKVTSLTIVGIIALIFIFVDLLKMFSKQTQKIFVEKVKMIFRTKEMKTFSSMTAFLVAAFITMLLFEKYIAITSLSFIIFGDLFSKIFGLGFGKKKIFDKTLEGSLAYLGSVLICSYILYNTIPLGLPIILIGAVSAPIIELFSININDNFTVPILSATSMTVAVFFGL
ncbi:MAG: glycerol-3-phosphate acyltransferase [Candidatus Lokiarchaeota archaeon]